MTAAPTPAAAKPSGSLNERVGEVEQRIAGRQKAIGERAATIFGSVREKLSSPVTLLLAVAGGIGLGYFTRHRMETGSSRAPDPKPDVVAVRPSIFATLLDAFTLVSTVLAMVPSFAALVPSFRREPDVEAGDPR